MRLNTFYSLSCSGSLSNFVCFQFSLTQCTTQHRTAISVCVCVNMCVWVWARSWVGFRVRQGVCISAPYFPFPLPRYFCLFCSCFRSTFSEHHQQLLYAVYSIDVLKCIINIWMYTSEGKASTISLCYRCRCRCHHQHYHVYKNRFNHNISIYRASTCEWKEILFDV